MSKDRKISLSGAQISPVEVEENAEAIKILEQQDRLTDKLLNIDEKIWETAFGDEDHTDGAAGYAR